MAQRALGAGRVPVRRRAMFGLFDAEGWTWAWIKAGVWSIVAIFLLFYIPDRAYYFTVSPTIDLGLYLPNPASRDPNATLLVPVNLCPPVNRDLPCPAPAGATLPWAASPPELALPEPRTGASAVQSGTRIFLVGGSDAAGTAQPSVFMTTVSPQSNLARWEATTALPAARSGAAVAFVAGLIYVIGGVDEGGAPTNTVFVGTPDLETGLVSEWVESGDLVLPEARADAAVAVAADGAYLIGGTGQDGAPATTVWKASLPEGSETLGGWEAMSGLPQPRTGAIAALAAPHLFVYGGADANGPTTTLLRATIGPATAAEASPSPENGVAPEVITRWEVGQAGTNLPEGRVGAAGFAAVGALYLAGGSDGSTPRSEVYWAVPDGDGNIAEWRRLEQVDLPADQARSGAASFVSGGNAFIVGGMTSSGPSQDSLRANLTPGQPFFRIGAVGATIPGLKIEGEIGQQLGWAVAASAGVGNLVILTIIALMVAHRERSREILGAAWRRMRRR